MLQKFCINNIFLSSAFLLMTSSAQAILFLAPNASQEKFQKYALQKNQQTYSQWYLDKTAKDESEAHPQILGFSQRALQENGPPSKQVLADWDSLRHMIDLNKADREVLFLLAEKLHIEKENCRYALLDQELFRKSENPDLGSACEKKSQAVSQKIRGQLGPRDLLIIDGMPFSFDQIPTKLVSGIYQWRIISDEFEDQSFIGTAEEFASQNFRHEHWVNGKCDDYKLNHKDFSVLAQSQIYFSEDCVAPGLPPPKNFSTWASDHKTLLWGLGILAGGFAAYQLKDKTLMITRP